jgi:hypothetical protein
VEFGQQRHEAAEKEEAGRRAEEESSLLWRVAQTFHIFLILELESIKTLTGIPFCAYITTQIPKKQMA